MALSYKARRRWSLIILLIGLPLYIVVAVNVVDLFDRPSIWIEFLVYVGLGIVWILPFKFVFLGVGQADPDAQPEDDDPRGTEPLQGADRGHRQSPAKHRDPEH